MGPGSSVSFYGTAEYPLAVELIARLGGPANSENFGFPTVVALARAMWQDRVRNRDSLLAKACAAICDTFEQATQMGYNHC
jgi:hypothetical protein